MDIIHFAHVLPTQKVHVFIVFIFSLSHPLAISNLLSARHYSQIAFVSDATAEPIPNHKMRYCNRDSKSEIWLIKASGS